MSAMKELFGDVLQQVMESELELELGFEKSQRSVHTADLTLAKNYRNGFSKKTTETQLGEIEVKIPRDRNGSYEPKILEKYARKIEWKAKYYLCMDVG